MCGTKKITPKEKANICFFFQNVLPVKTILTNINYIIARDQLKQDMIRTVAWFDVGKLSSLMETATQEPILKRGRADSTKPY